MNRKVTQWAWEQVRIDIQGTLIYDDYDGENRINLTADAFGRESRTIYDYCIGRIGKEDKNFTNLLCFLLSAIEGSNGDPRLTKFVETPNFRLTPKGKYNPDKATLAEELNDDIPVMAAYYNLLLDPEATEDQVIQGKNEVIREAEENLVRWKTEREK